MLFDEAKFRDLTVPITVLAIRDLSISLEKVQVNRSLHAVQKSFKPGAQLTHIYSKNIWINMSISRLEVKSLYVSRISNRPMTRIEIDQFNTKL